MPRKRRSYPAELKAKVALEALREEATMGCFRHQVLVKRA